MPIRGLLGLLLATASGCTVWAQGLARYDGQYVGELRLTKVFSGDCAEPPLGSLYPLTISNGQVLFKYVPRFDTALRGTVGPTGVFKASAKIRNGSVQMTGHTDGRDLTAEIVSPSCNYTFQTRN